MGGEGQYFKAGIPRGVAYLTLAELDEYVRRGELTRTLSDPLLLLDEGL